MAASPLRNIFPIDRSEIARKKRNLEIFGVVLGLIQIKNASATWIQNERMNIDSSDVVIRKAILAAMDAQEWAPRTAIQITVTNGIVELNGCVADQLERAKLTALAAKISGVANVIDQMTRVEPGAPAATTNANAADDMALAALLTQ